MDVCLYIFSYSFNVQSYYKDRFLLRNFHFVYACIRFYVGLKKKSCTSFYLQRYAFWCLLSGETMPWAYLIFYFVHENFGRCPMDVIQRESCINRFHAKCLWKRSFCNTRVQLVPRNRDRSREIYPGGQIYLISICFHLTKSSKNVNKI